ncbi:MAG: glycine C-acetyltransferase [Ardenticatenales bacterium]|nr:glycine C-acetyltransferase [Ardenticatenales bacterium]
MAEHDPLAWINDEMKALREQGLVTTIREIESPQGAWLIINGKRVLNFCSNNYLGLANDPRLVVAARMAMDRQGIGPGAVRSIAGTMSIHTELERRLAAFKGVPATVVLQSGFNANTATIPAIVGREDIIFSDRLNHASIIDGCRLSRAKVIAYEHNSPESLEAVIQENKAMARRMMVITDGVFSMDGDIAPLDKLTEVAKRHGAIMMVDDAHGEGVLGKGGRGIVDHFGLHGQVDIEVGTLSKAFGVMGGVVAGSTTLIRWLKQQGRPFLFSSALTVPDTAACLAAVDILEQSTELVDKLWANAEYFKKGMKELGFNTGQSQTPITPVILGEAPVAQDFSRRLFDENVFATAIAFPTVPHGTARIRVMPSAAHSTEDLDFALDVFKRIGREVGVVR